MTFLVVTKLSSTCVKLDLGIYADPTDGKKTTPQFFNPKHIKRVRIRTEIDPQVIEVESVFGYETLNGPLQLTWQMGSPPHPAMIVESIDGVAPTSALDLAEKIALLMA